MLLKKFRDQKLAQNKISVTEMHKLFIWDEPNYDNINISPHTNTLKTTIEKNANMFTKAISVPV